MFFCEMCSGRGMICPRCRRGHKPGDRNGTCSSRREQLPCPARRTTPHAHIECDVCRVRELRPGPGAVYRPLHWSYERGLVENEPSRTLHLCPECSRRYIEIRRMTLEHLMGERAQFRAGEWLGTPPALSPAHGPDDGGGAASEG